MIFKVMLFRDLSIAICLSALLLAGCYRAPPQLQANNGLLIVDDLGADSRSSTVER